MANAYVNFVKKYAKDNNLKYGEALKKSKDAWKKHKEQMGIKPKTSKSAKSKEPKQNIKMSILQQKIERDELFQKARDEKKAKEKFVKSLERIGKTESEIAKELAKIDLKKAEQGLLGGALTTEKNKKVKSEIQKIKFSDDKATRRRILNKYNKLKKMVETGLSTGNLLRKDFDDFIYNAKILAGTSKTNQYARAINKLTRQFNSKKFDAQKKKVEKALTKSELREKARAKGKEVQLERAVGFSLARPQMEKERKQFELRKLQLQRQGVSLEEAEAIAKEEQNLRKQQGLIQKQMLLAKSRGLSPNLLTFNQFVKKYQDQNKLTYQTALTRINQGNLFNQYKLSQLSKLTGSASIYPNVIDEVSDVPISMKAKEFLTKKGELKKVYQKKLDDVFSKFGKTGGANDKSKDEAFLFSLYNTFGKLRKLQGDLQLIKQYPKGLNEGEQERIEEIDQNVKEYEDKQLGNLMGAVRGKGRSVSGLAPVPGAPLPPGPAVVSSADLLNKIEGLNKVSETGKALLRASINQNIDELRNIVPLKLKKADYIARARALDKGFKALRKAIPQFNNDSEDFQSINYIKDQLFGIPAYNSITGINDDFSFQYGKRKDPPPVSPKPKLKIVKKDDKGKSPLTTSAIPTPPPEEPKPLTYDEQESVDKIIEFFLTNPDHDINVRSIEDIYSKGYIINDISTPATKVYFADRPLILNALQEALDYNEDKIKGHSGDGLDLKGGSLSDWKKGLLNRVQKIQMGHNLLVKGLQKAKQLTTRKNKVQEQNSIDGEDRTYFDVSEDAYDSPSSRAKKIGNFHYNQQSSNEEHAVYVNEDKKELIIGFRGSTTKEDFLNSDKHIVGANLKKSQRFMREKNFVSEILSLLPNYKVVFTGHSLGGSIAIEMGNLFKKRAVVFNAGASLVPEGMRKTSDDDVKFYSVKGDLVSANGVGRFKDTRLINTTAGNSGTAHGVNAFKGANEGGFSKEDTLSQKKHPPLEETSQTTQTQEQPQGEEPNPVIDAYNKHLLSKGKKPIKELSEEQKINHLPTKDPVVEKEDISGGAFHRLVHQKADNLVKDVMDLEKKYNDKNLEEDYKNISTLLDYKNYTKMCDDNVKRIKQDLHELSQHKKTLTDKHSQEIVEHQIKELTHKLGHIIKYQLPNIKKKMEEKFSKRLNHDNRRLTDKQLLHKDHEALHIYNKQEHNKKVGSEVRNVKLEGEGFESFYKKYVSPQKKFDMSKEKDRKQFEYQTQESIGSRMVKHLGKKIVNKMLGRGLDLSINDHKKIINAMNGKSLNQLYTIHGKANIHNELKKLVD